MKSVTHMQPTEQRPLVSVVMGVWYHRSDTSLLQRSVNSVLDQTYEDFEMLICDDGSSADAMSYLDQLSKQDKRVKLIRPGDCTALSEKLNVCLQASQGKYIARMDDDDYSYPERFQKQITFLDSHPEMAFVGSNVRQIRNGRPCGERLLPEYPQVPDFYMTQPYIHPALMFRKVALAAVGGYSEDRRQVLCEDYDLLLRLYTAGYRGSNLQENLLDYTVSVKAKGSRKFRHRCNESVTRWARFRELGVLPKALPFVIKPLAVGLLPEAVLKKIKDRQSRVAARQQDEVV